MNSGIRPNLSRSSGITCWNMLPLLACRSGFGADIGANAHRAGVDAPLDDVGQPFERAAADKQDVGGVELHILLLRVLAPALRRHVGDGALQDLEQRLLHALAADVAGDRGVLALAGDLVDLVDIDDAALGVA